MDFILAQILGLCALIVVCIGYFLKDKPKFLISQVVGNFFYASAFFVVDAYVGGTLVMVSLVRCIYLYYAEKYNFKYTKQLLPIFIVLFIRIFPLKPMRKFMESRRTIGIQRGLSARK